MAGRSGEPFSFFGGGDWQRRWADQQRAWEAQQRAFWGQPPRDDRYPQPRTEQPRRRRDRSQKQSPTSGTRSAAPRQRTAQPADARPRTAQTPADTRQRRAAAEPPRAAPRAQPVDQVTRTTTARRQGPAEQVRAAAPAVAPPPRRPPAGAAQPTSRFGLPGITNFVNEAKQTRVGARADITLRGGLPAGMEMPRGADGRVQPVSVRGDVAVHNRGVDANLTATPGIRYAGPEVPSIATVNITGVNIRNGVPVSAGYQASALGGLFNFSGSQSIDPAKMGGARGSNIQATVNLSELTGVQLNRRRDASGRPVGNVNATAHIDGNNVRFRVEMDVDSAVLGGRDRRGSLTTGAGRIVLTGTRDARGNTRVEVEKLDVANARLSVPSGDGRTDTVRAAQLSVGSGSNFVLQNGRMVSARVDNAQATGLNTELSVTNGRRTADGRPERAIVTASDTGVRNISFSLKPVAPGEHSPGRDPNDRSDFRFQTDTTGLNLQLNTGGRGFTVERDGLMATLQDGTQITSGAGHFEYNGSIQQDGGLRVGSWAMTATGDAPLTLRSKANLHTEVEQAVANAVGVRARLNGDVALTMRNFDSTSSTYDYSIKADLTGLPNERGEPSIAIRQLQRGGDTGVVASGTVDRPTLRLTGPQGEDGLRVRRNEAGELSIDGKVTGSLVGAGMRIPLGAHGPVPAGFADMRIAPLPNSQLQPQTQISVPLNVKVDRQGAIVSAGTAPAALRPEDAALEDQPMLAGCQAALNGLRTMDSLAEGRVAACLQNARLIASHQNGDVTGLGDVDRTLARQDELLAASAERARQLELGTADEAERNRMLDATLRAAGIDPHAPGVSANTAMQALDPAMIARRAKNAEFDATADLGPHDRSVSITNTFTEGRFDIPANTTVQVKTRSSGSGPEHDIVELTFANPENRPVSIYGGVRLPVIGSITGDTAKITGLRLRTVDGKIVTEPMGLTGSQAVWDGTASTITNAIAGPATSPNGPVPRAIVPRVLGNILDANKARIDLETNPASVAANALQGSPLRDLLVDGMRNAAINRAVITTMPQTEIRFGGNVVTLKESARLEMRKAAGSQQLTIEGQGIDGRPITLGATSVRTEDRSLAMSRGTVDGFTLTTGVRNNLTFDQAIAFRGINAADVRMSERPPAGSRRPSWSFGPASVTGDFTFNTSQAPDPPYSGSGPRRFGEITSTATADLTVDGPLSVRNLEMPAQAGTSGGAIQELTMRANNTRVQLMGDQITLEAPGTGDPARLVYGGTLRGPEPTPIEINVPPDSVATARVRKLSFYLGDAITQDGERYQNSHFHIEDLRSETAGGGPNGGITGNVTMAGTRFGFRSTSGVFTASTLQMRNISGAPDNFSQAVFPAIHLRGTRLSASVGDDTGRANMVIDGDLRYSLGINRRGDALGAAGALMIDRARAAMVAGGSVRMPFTINDFQRKLDDLKYQLSDELIAAERPPAPQPAPRRQRRDAAVR